MLYGNLLGDYRGLHKTQPSCILGSTIDQELVYHKIAGFVIWSNLNQGIS